MRKWKKFEFIVVLLFGKFESIIDIGIIVMAFKPFLNLIMVLNNWSTNYDVFFTFFVKSNLTIVEI